MVEWRKPGDSDRNGRELETLMSIMELAGAHDQLNLPNLSGFEVIARRTQLLFDVMQAGGAMEQRPHTSSQ